MTHGQLPPLPFPSVNVRPAIVILSVISLPVASAQAVGDPQQACALTPSRDASQAYANALEQSIHGDNADRQHHPHTANEIPNCHSDSPLILIRQYLFVTMITAYLICKCAKYWAEARADSARRVSQARQVRRRCDHGISSGAPISADDDPTPVPAAGGEVHDGRNVRTPVSKGRQFSTVVARNHSSSIHASNASEPLDRAASPSLIREDQDRRDKPNATNVNAIALGSSSSHILSGTAQVSFRSEPQVDPSWTPVETGLFSADSVTKRAWSLPEPAGVNHGQTPLRNPSLPHPNYVRMPPPSTKTNSLETTLYAGSKDLGPPPVIQWFILFIEVNLEDEDPEHNLHCFEEMIKQSAPESTSLYFESLASRDATPDKIKDKLTLLYLRAGWVSDDSLVFVFLTGTGDGTNRMCLRNGKVLTEEDIRGYISDVRTRSGLTNIQTVPVIFDICRVNKDVPGAEVCRVVELMWSCSRGQQAHALGFDPKLHVPNSCFLLALFWAAYDVSNSDSLDFEKAFKSRLGQLVRIRRYSHDYYISESGECEQCGIGEKCTSPGPQDPEGQQVGWDAIASLGALIMERYPEYVRNVVTVLTGEMRHCEIWEATKAASSSYGSQPDNIDQRVGCKEEHRGATQHVAAGSARDLVSEIPRLLEA